MTNGFDGRGAGRGSEGAGRGQPPQVIPLAELRPGRAGRIVELGLAEGERLAAGSPLRQGLTVRVVEAVADEWLHVRIGYREYSVPMRLAQRILVEVERGAEHAEQVPASEAYAVLFSREGRTMWRVRVVRRDTGTVVFSSLHGSEEQARREWAALRADAERMDAEGFRAAHGLA